MHQDTQDNNYIIAKALALSLISVFLLFIWQGHKGFNLWDEGFLWYGVQRVLQGEVPIRDFMAYDPGRYYWSAAFASITGDNGIIGLRVSVAIFQVLGLFTGLLLIAQSTKIQDKHRILFWTISAATLVVWMFPRHKLFDISLSIFLIGNLAFLIRSPTSKRYFITGAGVGLAAVFGRNHGVYGVAGSLGVMAWLSIKRTTDPNFLKGLILWSAGVATGFLPVMLMAIVIPGFAAAFVDSIRFLFEQQATNLPLPVPWPWTVDFSATSIKNAAGSIMLGLFFMGTLLFGGLTILWVVLQRIKVRSAPPALVAAAFLALPYAHFAFSRADVGHLSQGIFPTLIGTLIILSTLQGKIKWTLTAILCITSIWLMHGIHAGWQCRSNKRCVTVEISGSKLQVKTGTANDIALIRRLTQEYATDGRPFIAAPFWPGAYALMERKSPMWETYALFPRSAAFEKKEIERIKSASPGFALIFDFALDGRDSLRFRNSHPLIYQYIQDNFDTDPNSPNPQYQIFKARSREQ